MLCEKLPQGALQQLPHGVLILEADEGLCGLVGHVYLLRWQDDVQHKDGVSVPLLALEGIVCEQGELDAGEERKG